MHVPHTPVLSKHAFPASASASASIAASSGVATSIAASTDASSLTTGALEHAVSIKTSAASFTPCNMHDHGVVIETIAVVAP